MLTGERAAPEALQQENTWSLCVMRCLSLRKVGEPLAATAESPSWPWGWLSLQRELPQHPHSRSLVTYYCLPLFRVHVMTAAGPTQFHVRKCEEAVVGPAPPISLGLDVYGLCEWSSRNCELARW
jgi:hypothetical protein